MPPRVGIDLVDVEEVAAAVREHGERYLQRVYTIGEVEDCRRPDGVDPERLAARFAAKEAALKVLRPVDGGIPWSTIEVRRAAGGWVDLRLSGAAADQAAREGLRDFAVSLTHEAGLASAVVVATYHQAARP